MNVTGNVEPLILGRFVETGLHGFDVTNFTYKLRDSFVGDQHWTSYLVKSRIYMSYRHAPPFNPPPQAGGELARLRIDPVQDSAFFNPPACGGTKGGS